MRRNLAARLPRGRSRDPMREHDALPRPLRLWAAQAKLPWCPRSLRRAWDKALRRTGCPQAALRRLDACEAATLARERGPRGLAGPAPRPGSEVRGVTP